MRRMTTHETIKKMIDERISQVEGLHLYEHRFTISKDWNDEATRYRLYWTGSFVLDKGTSLTMEDINKLFPNVIQTNKQLSMVGTWERGETHQGTITSFQIVRQSQNIWTFTGDFEQNGEKYSIYVVLENEDIIELITDTWVNINKKEKKL